MKTFRSLFIYFVHTYIYLPENVKIMYYVVKVDYCTVKKLVIEKVKIAHEKVRKQTFAREKVRILDFSREKDRN